MRSPWTAVALCSLLLVPGVAFAADHNDPNAVNSIFADIDVSAADLYDIFGFPSDDKAGGEKVVLALTFASVPKAGTFDTDMLYRIRIIPARGSPAPGTTRAWRRCSGTSRRSATSISSGRRRDPGEGRPRRPRRSVDFIGFPGGTFSRRWRTNAVETIRTPDGFAVKAFFGGRDDAFFNDLPGFFRSINYAPQFYHVPHGDGGQARAGDPEDSARAGRATRCSTSIPPNPRLGQGVKLDLPPGPMT